MWRAEQQDPSLLALAEALLAMLLIEHGRAEAAVRTIGEMAYERWPAGGRN